VQVIAIIPTADRQKRRSKPGWFRQLDLAFAEMGVKVAFRESSGPAPAPREMCLVPKTAVRNRMKRCCDGSAERSRRAPNCDGDSTTADEAIIGSDWSQEKKLLPIGRKA